MGRDGSQQSEYATDLQHRGKGATLTPMFTFSGVGHSIEPKVSSMCRNIRQLHNFEPSATTDEVRAAALQYVRKIGGAAKPSLANQGAYEQAVNEIAEATQRLLDSLVTSAPPKDRDEEAAKAKARSAARFGQAG